MSPRYTGREEPQGRTGLFHSRCTSGSNRSRCWRIKAADGTPLNQRGLSPTLATLDPTAPTRATNVGLSTFASVALTVKPFLF